MLVIVLSVLLSGCLPNIYDQLYPVTPVELSKDDASHYAPTIYAPIEWWYYTGHLTDEEGREYGSELAMGGFALRQRPALLTMASL